MKQALIALVLMTLSLLMAASAFLYWSARSSLDFDYTYTGRAAALPLFVGQDGLARLKANGLVFRIRAAGFESNPHGAAVLLLHGFPATSAMWLPIVEPLVDAGFRVIAPDQRGYSPGARPEKLEAYQLRELVADVNAIADAMQLDRFHLVGHDWGAMVGWHVTASHSERVLSWTALSTPHPSAYAEAMLGNPEQQQRSRYIKLLRLPALPELLFTANDFSRLRGFTDSLPALMEEEYLGLFAEPGAASAALNWYRANDLQRGAGSVTAPTLFIWGNQDPIFLRSTIEAQRAFVDSDYAELELEAGHRLVLEKPKQISQALLQQLAIFDPR